MKKGVNYERAVRWLVTFGSDWVEFTRAIDEGFPVHLMSKGHGSVLTRSTPPQKRRRMAP